MGTYGTTMGPVDQSNEQTRVENHRAATSEVAAAPTNVARLTNLLAALERHHRELDRDALEPASELVAAPVRLAPSSMPAPTPSSAGVEHR
jgi:hypothetical protein